MAKSILRCPKCMKYTLKEKCERCNVTTISVKPPRYSPQDKYAAYRRKAKEALLKEKGLLE